MIKSFYVEFETNQPDNQCILELEHAIGNISRERARNIRRVPEEYLFEVLQKNESKNMKKRKFNPNVKIHCPKHGLQSSNPNAGHAIACMKCYPMK